ncbi:transposase, partial [Algoriphagus boritolerans]
ILKRKQRATDVEPVFGHLKYNKRMGRFLLRGKEKVEIETGLLAIAHNLAKKAG